MSCVLPEDADVDVSTLSRIFSNTTNSYKLIFFKAILNLLPGAVRSNKIAVLSLNEIAVEMAAISWYPISFFHLSFGSQDMLGNMIGRLRYDVNEKYIGNPKTQLALRKAIRQQSGSMALNRILDYVPYRLLEPFFSSNLRGMPDYKKNREIAKLAEHEFNTRIPLYRLVAINGNDCIEIHPAWKCYLLSWREIIIGWVAFKWIEYLQRRNPNVPAIPNKLEPPMARSSLKRQSDYWLSIMKISPVRCLYSGKLLDESNFSLDHFLPWSFVCHDQLWNLFPVLSSANSSKSNNLPNIKYIDCFIDLQVSGLQIANGELSKRKWENLTEGFVSDLRIVQTDLLSPPVVRSAYMATLPAMLSLAEQTGFSPGWIY